VADSHSAFGQDTFGRAAERAARFFGTPQYLAFSTQAAYAAPLILLAATRQAERDKLVGEKVEKRHEETERGAAERVVALKAETDKLQALLQANTDLTRQDKELTEQVAALTREIHAALKPG
jgi:uncharacterized membrane protein